jgi:acetyl-CoA acetyltransferase
MSFKTSNLLGKTSTIATCLQKEGGSVTAGNASGLNDGAAAMYLA